MRAMFLAAAVAAGCMTIWGCSSAPKASYKVVGRQGSNHFAVVEPNASRELLFEVSDQICPSGDFCKVHYWESPLDAPTSLPMDDEHMATQVGAFTFNPNNGYKQLLTSCDHPEATPDTCFS